MRIGIALSGGGVRSASQLGMAQYLREQGIKATVFAGTSGGSIVATLLALGYTPTQALELFRKTGNIRDVAYWHIISHIIKRQGVQGIFKGDKLLKCLDEVFDSKCLANISITTNYQRREEKLGIVTTDIVAGSQVIFTNCNNIDKNQINDDNVVICTKPGFHLSTIVSASCSIPGLFMPREIDGTLLVDGGVTNNLPSDIAFAMGADKVISMDLGYSGELEKIAGIYELLTQSLHILMERVVDNNNKSFGIYLNPKIYDVSGLDLSKMDECFDRGYRYMKTNFKAVDDYLEG